MYMSIFLSQRKFLALVSGRFCVPASKSETIALFTYWFRPCLSILCHSRRPEQLAEFSPEQIVQYSPTGCQAPEEDRVPEGDRYYEYSVHLSLMETT